MLAKHDHDFHVGQKVVWNGTPAPYYADKYGLGPFTVTATKDVPEDEIEYNHVTTEGGVGHHQWITIAEDPDLKGEHWWSGLWFVPLEQEQTT